MSNISVYRFRLRDKHSAELNRQGRAVNFVWNYCNETQRKAAQDGRQWLSGFTLNNLTAGSSKLLGINACTINSVCAQYERSRSKQRRPWLKSRGCKSLGWVPFRGQEIRLADRTFYFRREAYQPMHWRDLPMGAKIRDGSFSQDSKGHWYINIPVEAALSDSAPQSSIGIDLGLKGLATLSDGQKVENLRHTAFYARKLGSAQRASKKRLVRNIHARIANARKDHLHKASADIARNHNLIVVGDVSPSKLARTRMAKSVLDAGWATFKTMLRYKALRHNGTMIEVNERWTTQTCSECGTLPASRPRGIAGLGIREWECSDCGTVRDRDVNAARNILRVGLGTLAEGAARERSSHPITIDGDQA